MTGWLWIWHISFFKKVTEIEAGVNTGSGRTSVWLSEGNRRCFDHGHSRSEGVEIESPEALRNWDRTEGREKKNSMNDVNEKRGEKKKQKNRGLISPNLLQIVSQRSSGKGCYLQLRPDIKQELGIKPFRAQERVWNWSESHQHCRRRGTPRYHCEWHIHSEVNNSANAEWANTSGLLLLKTSRRLITRRRSKEKRNDCWSFFFLLCVRKVFRKRNSVKNKTRTISIVLKLLSMSRDIAYLEDIFICILLGMVLLIKALNIGLKYHSIT